LPVTPAASCVSRCAWPTAASATLRIAAQGLAAIVDVGSSNGTAVDGVGLAAGEPRPVGPEEQVEAGRSLLAIRPWRSPDPTVLGARRGVIAFNRPPRVARPY
jgi:hypothetical protein